MNNEFLKGISARERLHYLKNIVKLDSLQLSLYKDSIVPSLQLETREAKKEITRLNTTIQEKNSTITMYRYLTLALAVFSLGLLF